MTEFIYLHGFASGPNSQKACVFKERFKMAGLSLTIPDLQEDDFENLTLKPVSADPKFLFPTILDQSD